MTFVILDMGTNYRRYKSTMTINELIKQGDEAINQWDWQNAYRSWSNVLELEPNHAWVKVKLGKILLELNHLDEAEKLLLEDVKEYPDRPFAFLNLAKISQMRDDWFQAESRLEQLLRRFPDNEWAYLPYAQTLKQLGKLNKAERFCQMDIALHPNHFNGPLLLIEIALEKKQYNLAQKRIDRFLNDFPQKSSAVEPHERALQAVIDQTELSDYANYLTLPELKYRFICRNQLNYIYVEVPKAGSSSVVLNLHGLTHGEASDSETSRNALADSLRYPAKSLHQEFSNRLRSALVLEDHFIFTFVRNPYTRILSGFLNKIQKDSAESIGRRRRLGFKPHDEEHVSFAQFLERIRETDIAQLDIHFRPQWHLLGLDKQIKYDFIGHLENFDSDLQYVLNRISNKSFADEPSAWRGHATHANKSLKQFYGAEEQALVAEIYQDDFKFLGYGFGLGVR